MQNRHASCTELGGRTPGHLVLPMLPAPGTIQSLVISFLATRMNMGYEDAEALQNWIIVAEMFLAAIGMVFAFPWSEYRVGGAAKGMTWDSFMHAVSISDVISDVIHMVSGIVKGYAAFRRSMCCTVVKR